MSINSVRGALEKHQVGACLPHEHLLIDLQSLVDKPDPSKNPIFYEKLQMSNRFRIYSDPYAIFDNALIDDTLIAIKECKLAKASGIDTIVDVTLSDILRSPKSLLKISEESGVNIVMGCGHYIDGALSPQVKSLTEQELTDEIINDITKGVDGSKIKAGVIGEIGTSKDITDAEWRNLRAAGNASIVTGKGIHIHTSLWERNGLAVSKALLGMGVKPHKICINHIDVDLREDYLEDLLNLGVKIEFDNFGKEFYIPKRDIGLLKGRFAYDLERCRVISKLVKMNFTSQIFISNDICLKSMLCEYGGNGYGHILNNIKFMLQDQDISCDDINKITNKNVLDFLD